jgi:hypothetical protein
MGMKAGLKEAYRVLAIYPALRPDVLLARLVNSSCATSKEFITTKGLEGISKKTISPRKACQPLFNTG